MVKNPSTRAGDIRDPGSILGSGRSSGGRHGNPLQYSCLENPKDGGAWWATVHRVAESDMTEATQHTSTSEWALHPTVGPSTLGRQHELGGRGQS